MIRDMGGVVWRAATGPFAHRYEDILRREIVGSCETLLDLGCGRESPAGALVGDLRRSVGVDLHEPSIEHSRAAGLHHEHVRADALSIVDTFGPRSFDGVTALDLIEHLPKAQGWDLLHAMEQVARRKVVVFTPNRFLPQPAYDNNSLQEHLSGWTPAEFLDRGYRVYGVRGWKPLRGERASIRCRPQALWTVLSMWSQPFTEQRPEHAFQLLCVKDVS